MIKQSYPSLFTLTIGFIPVSIKRLLCNFVYKPVSSEKLAKAFSGIQGSFLKLFKSNDEKTLYLQIALFEVHIVNVIK